MRAGFWLEGFGTGSDGRVQGAGVGRTELLCVPAQTYPSKQKPETG